MNIVVRACCMVHSFGVAVIDFIVRHVIRKQPFNMENVYWRRSLDCYQSVLFYDRQLYKSRQRKPGIFMSSTQNSSIDLFSK